MLGIILNWIRSRFNHSRIQRQRRDIERQNAVNKNVVEHNNAPVEAYVSRDHSENIIVSGNNKQIRDRVCCSAIYNAFSSGKGVIVLHCGNSELESLLFNAFDGGSGLHLINESNQFYDPFLDMDKNQIAQLVLSSATDACKVQHNGGIYIKGLTDYLIARGQIPCARSYIRCPHDSMWRRIQEHVRNGNMSEEIAEEINDELTRGQVERGNVEHYFNVLYSQADTILANKDIIKSGNGINIKRAVDRNQVIVFDITPSASDLLMNVLLQEVKNCMSEGKRFIFVLDSIPADSSEALGKLLRNFSSKSKFVFAAEDAYAETATAENLFNSLLGKADAVFLSQHDSADTSEKFSNYLGKYQKMEINSTVTVGDAYSGRSPILPESTSSADIYSIQRVDRPRVEESDITNLEHNSLFIKKERRSEIIKAHCVYGNARGIYSEPRGHATAALRISYSRRFNFLVFMLLLIFIPPAAFVYSLVVCGRIGKIVSAILLFLMVAAIVIQIILVTTYGS